MINLYYIACLVYLLFIFFFLSLLFQHVSRNFYFIPIFAPDLQEFKLHDRAVHVLTEATRVYQFKSICDEAASAEAGLPQDFVSEEVISFNCMNVQIHCYNLKNSHLHFKDIKEKMQFVLFEIIFNMTGT